MSKMVLVAGARTHAANAWMMKLGVVGCEEISSNANKSAPRGAVKAALTPAATPITMNSLL
jgi:hypothetical protein